MKARIIAIRVGVAATLCVASTTVLAQYNGQQLNMGSAQPVYETAALPSYRQPAATYQPAPQYQGAPNYTPPTQYQPAQQQVPAPQYQPPQYQPAPAYQQAGSFPQGGYAPQAYAPSQPAARVAMQQGNLPTPVVEPIEPQGAPSRPTLQQGSSSESYHPAHSAGSYTSGEGGTTDYGYGSACPTAGCECADYGVSRYIQPLGRQWFVGIYSVGMTRSNSGRAKLAVLVDSPATYPYYPPSSNTILTSTDVDEPFQWGGEVRLGSTFGRRCDPCNPCGGYRPFAWEAGYWGIVDRTESTIVTDAWSDTDRMYGMVNFAGLEYDRDGAGATYAYRPVNDYYDYQMPIEDPAVNTNNVRVLGFRARQSFDAQNVELNFFRFGNCGGCDPCGCGASRFSFNGLLGVRFLKLDENFQWATMFTTVDGTNNPNAGEPTAYTSFPTGDDNNLFYDIDTENNLVGFQFGGNMNYAVGCKWTLFCDSNFGVYGNHIEADHRVWSGGGGVVRFVNGGGDANVSTSKDGVSLLSECRLGSAYQLTCNCRLSAAYRVIGVTGVALATNQIASDYSNAAHVGYIDNTGSLILHGVQLGAEFKF